ncbi:L-lactate dehydrogenase complex protein LldE [Tahibacter aquaticus]|uniref:L-lactate dehydrogenase complex protein LldE n=1 Tax=Tahibacter aquaticus TaxID=520092 RepID=A0A4R6YZ27_9GAMM|nr:(Fe-S)-binding protein [Tahibacter aquaticus]TDR44148.1 L-lactate dehydrogenase complex protein LldE [Tahibacter aquaticus]
MNPPIPRHDRPADVYFFATCVVDLFMPEAGMDAIAVLEHAGVRVSFPAAQTCCGQPAYTSGFPADARAVARTQLDLFAQPWPIVVPSGSCAGMIRHHWPRLFADDAALAARAAAVAERVVEFTDFVVATLGLDLTAAQNEAIALCLHTSCSARRETDALRSGRQLLNTLPGVELRTQEHEPECCGFGGTFSIKHAEISAAMAGDKVDALLATGCSRYVSADCGCLLNLNTTLEKRGEPLRGQHIASFLRNRLRLDSEPAA